MERLWAPWRSPYIHQVVKKEQQEGCFLCTARDAEDREGLVLWRGAHTFVLLNRYPYISGHLMVVPKEHGEEFPALGAETLLEMMAAAQHAVATFRQESGAHGVNLGMNLGRSAGAGLVDHVHLHVVPRWTGDTSFMTLLGDVRVVSEDLGEVWDRLRPCFDGWSWSPDG